MFGRRSAWHWVLVWAPFPVVVALTIGLLRFFEVRDMPEARDATYLIVAALWPLSVFLSVFIAVGDERSGDVGAIRDSAIEAVGGGPLGVERVSTGSRFRDAVVGTAWLVLMIVLVAAPILAIGIASPRHLGMLELLLGGLLWSVVAGICIVSLSDDDSAGEFGRQ